MVNFSDRSVTVYYATPHSDMPASVEVPFDELAACVCGDSAAAAGDVDVADVRVSTGAPEMRTPPPARVAPTSSRVQLPAGAGAGAVAGAGAGARASGVGKVAAPALPSRSAAPP